VTHLEAIAVAVAAVSEAGPKWVDLRHLHRYLHGSRRFHHHSLLELVRREGGGYVDVGE
jgi:hypothetical protein